MQLVNIPRALSDQDIHISCTEYGTVKDIYRIADTTAYILYNNREALNAVSSSFHVTVTVGGASRQ